MSAVFPKKTVFCGNFFSFLNFLNFVVVDVSTFKIEEELYSLFKSRSFLTFRILTKITDPDPGGRLEQIQYGSRSETLGTGTRYRYQYILFLFNIAKIWAFGAHLTERGI